MLISAYAVCQLFSGPLLGRASDKTGRKPMLILSQAGTFIGFIITAFATTLPVLLLARAIDGATAGNLSLAQAYISDVTEPDHRAKSFGVIGIAFGLGFLIGPAISGVLAKYDYRFPIFAAAGLSALSILATSLLLPSAKPSTAAESGPGGKRLSLFKWGAYAEYFQRPDLSVRLLQFFVFAFSFAMFTSGLPLFCERRLTWNGAPFGPSQLGYAWAAAGFLGIFLQGPGLGRLVKRYGESALNRTGFGGYTAGYALLAFCHSVPMLAVVTAVTSVGGLVRPTLTSLITKTSSADEQGVVLGLTQSLTSVSQIAAPALTGVLVQAGFLTAWGLIASGVACIGLLLASRAHAPAQSLAPSR
jgi:MFS family permease